MRPIAAVCALLLVAAVWPAAAAPAVTDLARAERLDQLFADLKVAGTVTGDQAIENEIMELWLDSDDDEVDLMMRNAMLAMSVNAFDAALTYLDSIVMMKPDYSEGWNKRATVYFLQRRYAESIADIERTLALEPRHFGALAGLGWIMLELGEKARALEAFKAAVAVDPALARVRRQILVLEDQIGKGI